MIPHECVALPNPHLGARFNVSEGWRIIRTRCAGVDQLLQPEQGEVPGVSLFAVPLWSLESTSEVFSLP